MDNEIRYTLNKDISAELPKEIKSMTFQGFFTFLRKSLQIKYTRRIHIDSILKKCKGKFFKAVNDCLKKCLKINIKKLPQAYITNISIEYNKKFFDFTINDLYIYFSLMPYPMETILQKNYCIKGKETYFKYIFLSKINTLYSFYIQSNRYKKEIESMKKQKGIKMVLLYQFVSENFINYYHYSKPHVKKNSRHTEVNNFDNNFIINNNIINNNIYNINNFETNLENKIEKKVEKKNIEKIKENNKEKFNININFKKNHFPPKKEIKKTFFQIEKPI